MLLHIGYHKTGTTWLQDHLFDAPDSGFCAPWGVQSHEAIEDFVACNAFRFDGQAMRSKYQPRVDDAQNRGLLPVLSHEDLCGYPIFERYYAKSVIDRLHATFPDARVLIGIREQKSCILSHYRQYIRQGGFRSIYDFLNPPAKAGYRAICRLDHFEYHLMVGYCQRLFGTERVLVLPLELLRQDAELYLQKLYGFMGLPKADVSVQRPSNVGWHALTLRLCRGLNKHRIASIDIQRKDKSLSFRIRDKLMRHFNEVVPRSLSARMEARMRQEIEKCTAGYFGSSNRELQRITGIDLHEMNYDLDLS